MTTKCLMAGTFGAKGRYGGVEQDRIVAFGLLTRRDLDLLGPTFNRAWPVEEEPCFEDLLEALDEADRKFRQSAESRR